MSFLETGCPAAQVNLSLNSLGLVRNSKSFVYHQLGAPAQSDLGQLWRISANPRSAQQFPDCAEGDGSLVLSIRDPRANRDWAQQSRPISSGQSRTAIFGALLGGLATCLVRGALRSEGETGAHHGECSAETRVGAEGRGVAGSAQSETRNLPRVCKPTVVPFPEPRAEPQCKRGSSCMLVFRGKMERTT